MELTKIYTKEDKYFYRNGEDNWTVKAWETMKNQVEVVDKEI